MILKKQTLLIAALIVPLSLAAQQKPKVKAKPKPAANIQLALNLYKLGLFESSLYPTLLALKTGSVTEQKQALIIIKRIQPYLIDPDAFQFMAKILPDEIKWDPIWMLKADKELQDKNVESAQKYLARIQDPKWALAKIHREVQIRLALQDVNGALELVQNERAKLLEKPGQLFSKGDLALLLGQIAYENKRYAMASEAFREIPKDHPQWSLGLSELAWSEFMQGKLRSALSPLITIQSPHYQNFFDPEGLYLRGLIYLFACQYQEVDKVIQNFKVNYLAASSNMKEWIEAPLDLTKRGELVLLAHQTNTELKKGRERKWNSSLPFYVLASALDRPGIDRELRRIKQIESELKTLKTSKAVGNHRKVLNLFLSKRRDKAVQRLGAELLSEVTSSFNIIRKTQVNFDFLNVESLDGKRQTAQRKLAGDESISQKIERDEFSKNGFRYWPFDGEYWKDELGHYFYLGANSCEN